RHERRRRTARVRLLLDSADGERRTLESLGEAPRGVLVDDDGLGPQSAVATEVAPLRDPRAVESDEAGGERAGGAGCLEIPVRGRDELFPLPLALDDEARGDGLDASGGEALHHLLPEHRGDLVAVEPVEDASRLLRIDESLVDRTRVVEGVPNRVPRDL